MPNNFWMVVQTPENHEITRGQGFTLHGLTSKQKRRARRMEPDDRILFYVGGEMRKWTAIAVVKSKYFEDRTPIWESNGSRQELFPYRVKTSPSIVLDEADYIEARILAPRLEYVKRWPPELWPLAFFDTLHLIPQRDYRLIEAEMRRIRRQKRSSSRNTDRIEHGAESQLDLDATQTDSMEDTGESPESEQKDERDSDATASEAVEDHSSSGTESEG